MKTANTKIALFIVLAVFFASFSRLAFADPVKGIYLTQTTMENTAYLKYLIQQSKAVGINTFVIDMEIPSKRYEKNVALLKENNIRYVARVVVFPTGGHPEQINSHAYWEKRFALVKTAVDYGASEIQLDYIRYNTKQPASADNAKKISSVVQYFRDKIPPTIPLQADVFGISSFGESKHIGQNLRMMAESVNALCPMVYPSHFEPFREHAVTPYQTIYNSLRALRSQFKPNMPVKVYAFIEISNYRYPLPGEKRRSYILAEMKAVQDANADGWYVWSAHNKYDYLFTLMSQINHQGGLDATGGKIMTAEATRATTDVAEAQTTAKAEDAASAKTDATSGVVKNNKVVAEEDSDADDVDDGASSKTPVKIKAKTITAENEAPATRGPVEATTWIRPMSLH